MAAAISAAAVGCRRCAFSLRPDGRAAAVSAAMACARWTKDTPAPFARASASARVSKPSHARPQRASCNHGSRSPGRLRDRSP
jgi:hypothetical protein